MKPCCGRDHNQDGNCDRHPQGVTRPHEETWVRLAGGGGPGVAIRTVDPRGGPGEFVGALETPERSKLAAQAPAMARLLLRMSTRSVWDDPVGPLRGEAAKILRDAGVLP